MPFSRGIISDKGLHSVPDDFCVDCKNIRIVNSSTTARPWYKIVAYDTQELDENFEGLSIQRLVVNKGLYAIIGSGFYKVDDSEIPFSYELLKSDLGENISPLVYGRYILLCNGTGTVNVFDTLRKDGDDGTGRLTATLPEGAKISFWDVFQDNIRLFGADEKSNVVYKSRAGKDNSPQDILNFTGDGSDDMVKRSPITGSASLRGKLYFFTETSIELVTTNSVVSVWDVLTMFSTPIAGENQLANNRCAIVADDVVFFWTKGNQLKTLEFRQGFTEIWVGDITNRKNQSIQRILDTLDEDQSNAFGYYHKEKKLLFFHLKQKGEQFNNMVLVYDVINDSFLIDDNKYYSDVAKVGMKYYAGSSINMEMYEDETGNSDRGDPISWSRTTKRFDMGNPNYRKEFRQINITGEKDNLSEILVEVIADGKAQYTTTISGEQWSPWGLASVPTAIDMTAWEAVTETRDGFEKIIRSIRTRNKNIQLRFSGSSYGEFALSSISIGYRPLARELPEDILTPFTWE